MLYNMKITKSSNKSNVMKITSQNFPKLKKMADQGKTIYLLLYADYCGHCKVFKPVWEEISNEMQNEMSELNAIMARIELSSIKKIDDKYVKDILGYPTIRKIDRNGITDFKEGRDKEKLKNWMRIKKGGTRYRKKRSRKTRKVYRKTPYPF